jgi:hypothetical protein
MDPFLIEYLWLADLIWNLASVSCSGKRATIHLIDHVTLIFNQTLLRTEDFLSVEHETEARFQIIYIAC